MAEIQKKYRKKFTPFLTTKINGQVTKVTIAELEQNARKYINTAVGYMYENYAKLKDSIDSRTPDAEFERLNMGAAKRGDLFDEEKRKKMSGEHLYKTDFLVKQKAKRERLLAKAQSNLAAKQGSVDEVAELRKQLEAKEKELNQLNKEISSSANESDVDKEAAKEAAKTKTTRRKTTK